jgi:hypothetical protein
LNTETLRRKVKTVSRRSRLHSNKQNKIKIKAEEVAKQKFRQNNDKTKTQTENKREENVEPQNIQTGNLFATRTTTNRANQAKGKTAKKVDWNVQ